MRFRRIFAALAAMVTAITALVTAQASPASAAIVTYISILRPPTNAIGPMVIDIEGWSTQDGAVAHLWLLRTSGNVANQRWHINRVGSTAFGEGIYQFTNMHSQKCLSASVAPINNSYVTQASCGLHSSFQRWIAEPVSSVDAKWVMLRNEFWGSCLDAYGAGYDNGVRLQTFACHGRWNQRFNIY